MSPPPQRRDQNDTVRSRDEALVRIRRATVAMGLTASVATVGIGVAVAVAGTSPRHVPTTTFTTPAPTTPAPTTPAPTTTKATTTSRQS